jgi:hypothetical protein
MMHEAQMNLAYAKKILQARASADGKGKESSLSAYALFGNEWLSSRISPHAMFVVMVAAWIAIWTFIGLRILGFHFLWKSSTSAAIVLFIVSTASTSLSWQTAERPAAMVVQAPVTSGANADIATAKVMPGQVVEPIQKRGDSIRVRTENGEAIWLPKDSIEVI